jgi:hypothetical protein
MEERRFDVRVPVANTLLLEHLTQESEKTGIGEARLLVLYATKYVELLTRGGALPLVTAAPAGSLGASGQGGGSESVPQPSLDGKALDALFGDPD